MCLGCNKCTYLLRGCRFGGYNKALPLGELSITTNTKLNSAKMSFFLNRGEKLTRQVVRGDGISVCRPFRGPVGRLGMIYRSGFPLSVRLNVLWLYYQSVNQCACLFEGDWVWAVL